MSLQSLGSATVSTARSNLFEASIKIAIVRQAFLFVPLVFLLSSPVFAQGPVADWFPIHAGNRWIYAHETRDENGNGRAHLEIHSWKTEETVIGSWAVPEGTLFATRVRVVEGAPREGYRVGPDAAYLIRGDCLYASYGEAGWNQSTHQLTPDFRNGLSAGYLSPDFCFPLEVHKAWGARHSKDWQVQSASADQKTFHINNVSSYPGSGMTVDIWFERGVGIVREVEIHHGTIGEQQTRLIRFEPVPER